jgi:putative ABC transport system permease protein
MEGVRKAGLAKTFEQIYANGSPVFIDVYDEFKRLETVNVYEGKLPEYDNEVVITGTLSKKWSKEIGDTISLEYNGYSADYLVVGLSQTLSNSGNMLKITREGMKRLYPTFRLNEIQVYLENDFNREVFIQAINKRYGMSEEDVSQENNQDERLSDNDKIKQIADEKIAKLMKLYGVDSVDYSILVDGTIISGNTRKYVIKSVVNFPKMANANLGTFKIMFGSVTLLILVTTMITIALMLALIMKLMITQRKVQYGIYKALGYTSHQLMFQIACSMMPTVIVGAFLGTIINHLCIGKISDMVLNNFGVSEMTYHVSPVIVIAMDIFLISFTFFTAMIDARRVRHITPYNLLTD